MMHNERESLRGFFPLFFLLSFFVLFLTSCGGEAETADGATDTNTAIASAPSAPQPATDSATTEKYEVRFDTLAEKNEKREYEINAAYPQIRGMKNRAAEDLFNNTVRNSVGNMVREFIASVMPSEDLEKVEGMESTSAFELQPTVHMSDHRYLSVELAAYIYNAGAAHPNSFSSSMNFDVRKGRFIGLGDLFNPDAEYLEFIADYCMNELRGRDISDEEWIGRGAGQEIANYRTFFITPDGLTIHFDPYQVASYAAGPQEVLIPWGRLARMMH